MLKDVGDAATTYVSFISDEVAQISMLHVRQHDERRALAGQADSQQREHIGMAEVFHDDALLQELRHLFYISDSCHINAQYIHSSSKITTMVFGITPSLDLHMQNDSFKIYPAIHFLS